MLHGWKKLKRWERQKNKRSGERTEHGVTSSCKMRLREAAKNERSENSTLSRRESGDRGSRSDESGESDPCTWAAAHESANSYRNASLFLFSNTNMSLLLSRASTKSLYERTRTLWSFKVSIKKNVSNVLHLFCLVIFFSMILVLSRSCKINSLLRPHLD